MLRRLCYLYIVQMSGETDIWQFLAGLGFFLYGMHLIDATIRKMEGRGFKLFLKKNTNTRLGAVMSGLVVTAILQSSSIVNLLLLSFSGAGIMALRNSLGVVLGSNIGGTVNSWLVALLGFKVELGAYALALVAIAGIVLFLAGESSRWYRFFSFVMGLGLIILGLDFARTSMEGFLSTLNLGELAGYPLIVFLLAGFVITAIVQTSAATVMIVLSALYAEAIPLDMAITVVLGAELGTTLKIVLGSLKGAAVKRRVAAGNLLLNLASTGLGFVFLSQIIKLLQLAGLSDPLFVLVAFQSVVNIAGAVIFFFLLPPLSVFLDRFFEDERPAITWFIPLASPDLPEPATDLLEKEARYFLLRSMAFVVRFFGIEASHIAVKYIHDELQADGRIPAGGVQYFHLKASEDEMIRFSALLRKPGLSETSMIRINQLLISVRHAMYAAKAVKDIEHNIRSLKSSADEKDFQMYQHFREEMEAMMETWLAAWNAASRASTVKALDGLLAVIEKEHRDDAANIYRQPQQALGEPSTQLNVNREMYNAGRSLVMALRELNMEDHGKPQTSVTSV